ncbi:uncharacterized protein LOC113752856 [Coffea eugenioides]|uniref:uncharacterized protein LOC113752856 n=1 Tax=Coffea eugenioides TaxID=49369 RepID=UPI000F613E43|nr:uncharacterized protein LOC113752856 [Coffea eugenioides]
MRNQVLGVATQVPVMAIVILLVLLFVGIGIIVVIHICMVGRAFRRGFGNRNSSNNMVVERGELGSRSMSREELPCFDFKAKEIKGATPSPCPADCAVCLEDFKAGEKCRLLPLGSADFDRAVEESSRYVAAGVRRDQVNIVSGTEGQHTGNVGTKFKNSESANTVEYYF